ncbi:endonuclease [Rhizobium rhizosphaerae]|uniref:Endonuclease n=1 Tax=Xaviernesmea rhizosphaerae TaxID=1672749 RepID=A0A1Q9AEZ2_9HYPH|nr:endonuclease/exonuclease/phosphatase family protein [Xaviernesmea rhizosphaerae]OLP53545.1 endonuclease [Xaviernesmea rhizosphaerae]
MTTAFRLITYNVHSCIGTDRRHDPERVAEVIAAARPDIIALQELDVGRLRTKGVDQAQRIADHLKMTAHFHPAMHVEEEQYGDAILTALPSRLRRAGSLPSIGEPRGAIWVEIAVAGRPVQVINTHLGLRGRERSLQAQALLGPDWMGHADCQAGPAILTGDFNAVTRSPAFRRLNRALPAAADPRTGRLAPTFPSRFPLMRLDHVFPNSGLTVTACAPIANAQTRLASDHLPLLATLDFAEAADRQRDQANGTSQASAR